MTSGAIRIPALAVAVVVAGLHSPVRADQPRKRPIAVLELRSRGLDADLAASLTDKVKKDSFIVFGRDVLVRPEQTTRLDVELIPSPDFVARYRARANTYRALAWTFTGLALAAAGTATGLLIWNDGRLGDYRQDKERYESELVGDGEKLNAQADSINAVDNANWAIGGVGLACLGTALYFWLAGDSPGRYDHIDHSRAAGPAFDLQPSFGNGSVGATARLRY